MLDLTAHAASCGRLDCGHLYRSDSRAVRRAVLLYLAEGAGYAVDLDREAPEVAAVLGTLRTVGHPRPLYVRDGSRYARTTPATAVPLPDVTGLRLTPERVDVYRLLWQGCSTGEAAALSGRSRETVRSHAGNLRRLTGAHDAPSALVALALAGAL